MQQPPPGIKSDQKKRKRTKILKKESTMKTHEGG